MAYEGTTWVELSVKRGDETSPIIKVHYAGIEALKHFNLEPLNATRNNYRPHLTLARIVMPKQIEVWPKNLYTNIGNFNLEFGLSDEKSNMHIKYLAFNNALFSNTGGF